MRFYSFEASPKLLPGRRRLRLPEERPRTRLVGRPFRIVLTTTGTLGEVLPLVAIGIRLRAFGLEPVLATMPEYAPAAHAEGIAFHPVRPGALDLASDGLDEAAVARAVTRDLRAGFDLMLPHLGNTLADLREVMRAADLVVAGPLSVVARIVAEQMRMPVATVMLQPMAFRSATEPPRMREAPFAPIIARLAGPRPVRLLYRAATLRGRRSLKPIAALRQRLHLPAVHDEIVSGINASEVIFAMYPPAFARLPSDAPAHARGAGFPGYDGSRHGADSLPPALERFLRAGPPPLVFTLGSFVVHAPGSFYVDSAAAATAAGRRAILLVGDHALPADSRLARPSVAVAGHVPHSLLFRRAAAVVHHGGMGTAAQALCAGVPQIVCPLFGDQFDNADRLRRLGVAQVIPLRRYSFTAALRALKQPALIETARVARELASTMVHDEGPELVAHWIADRLQGRSTPIGVLNTLMSVA